MFQRVTLNESFKDKILYEQIRVLYRTVLPILGVNFLVSTAFLYGLWNIAPRATLVIWFVMILSLIAIRLGIYYFYYKPRFNQSNARHFGVQYTVGSFVSGLLWGIGALLLFPEQQLEYQLFILFVLVGMSAGSVSSITIYLPTFLAYLPISLLPLSFKLLLMDSPIHVSLGIMLLAYLVSLLYFGINFNRSLIQTLTLRFQNSELVDQLVVQKNEAELANQAKSKFLAAASHDLRQPLHSLTLFTSVLNEYELEPRLRNVVDKINLSVQALQGLFNALLDISRLDAGILRVTKTNIPLQKLLDHLANDFNTQAHDKNLTIYWPSTSVVVYTDQTLLDQILRNYLSNAIRYTKEGDITVRIEESNDQITISVLDTGIGIAPDDHDTIFKEFHQLNNPERDRTKGLGLGLAIVRRTAKLLEHPISVESHPGKGSIFTISLPKSDGHQLSTMTERPNNEIATKQGLLIVVIDDEADICEGTRALLEQWNCRVITAVDIKSALQQLDLAGKSPDAIIADYRLRNNQTGIQAIQAIVTRFKKPIPSLIITGDIEITKLQEVNTSGIQMLHKPVSALKLKTFIRHIGVG